MAKLTKLMVIVMILGLFTIGCENEQGPVGSDDLRMLNLQEFGFMEMPEGSVLESATFHAYAVIASGETVNIHRATEPWVEMEVTWNSFGEAYDPAIVASFTPTAVGWYSADVTSLVQSWLDGTYENYGMLLEQDDALYNRFFSSEYTTGEHRPKLDLCFNEDGEIVCYTVQRGVLGEVADAYIWELNPNYNAGDWTTFYTGLVDIYRKQTLITFELPTITEYASLGDYVWYDVDVDGIQDEGEIGVADVVVRLYDCQGALLATTLTDENGYYLFDNLAAGDYMVEFIPPDGFDFSPMDQGMDDAMDSDVDQTTGRTICINLDWGEHDMTWDAGIWSPPQDGCSLTIGYWKTHAGFGPQDDVVTPLLPVWLGTEGGDKSMLVDNVTIAHDILVQKTYGSPSNGITKLYAQLLASKLNILSGASDTDISEALSDADEFLAEYDWMDWDSLSKTEKKGVNKLKDKFDKYNNGEIGPGHCDDDFDGDDD